MAIKISQEQNPVLLYRAARDYPEFPHGAARQREFLKYLNVFNLNGSGPVDSAPAYVVAAAAWDKWINAKEYVDRLADDEFDRLKCIAERKPLPRERGTELGDLLDNPEQLRVLIPDYYD